MGNPETLSRSDTPDPAYLTAAAAEWQKTAEFEKKQKKGIKIQKSSKFKNHQNSKIIKIQKKLLYQNSFLFLWTGTFLYFVFGQPPICICICIFFIYKKKGLWTAY